MAAFAVLRFINRKSLTYLNCLKGGICNEKADEHSKEGFYGTGGSCAGGSYHISSECLLPLVRTTCRARRAEKLCKQEIIGNCVLQKGGVKWLRIRF